MALIFFMCLNRYNIVCAIFLSIFSQVIEKVAGIRKFIACRIRIIILARKDEIAITCQNLLLLSNAYFKILQVRWNFQGKPVPKDSHHKVGSDGNRHWLIIQDVGKVHAGRYSAIAENDAGIATTSALLSVQGT